MTLISITIVVLLIASALVVGYALLCISSLEAREMELFEQELQRAAAGESYAESESDRPERLDATQRR